MHEDIIARAGAIVEAMNGNAGNCVLAQLDEDGYPTAATISVSRAWGIQTVAFCTGLGSNWVKRIERYGRAGLCFSGPAYNITLVGDIAILTDLETKKALWYDGMSTYFKGPEDPGFCVLRFQTRRYSLMLSEQEGTARGWLTPRESEGTP